MACPSEFQLSPTGLSCVMSCPQARGFNTVGDKCMYTDNLLSITLNSLPLITNNGAVVSYTTLPNRSVYEAEITRVNAEIATALASANTESLKNAAFKNLQLKELAKSTVDRTATPEAQQRAYEENLKAYEQAKVQYYTLEKGDGWKTEEVERVKNSDATNITREMEYRYNELLAQSQQQKSVIDAIQGIKDKVMSMKDGMEYSVGAFSKQLEKVKNQINMNRVQKLEETSQAELTFSWIDTLLNIFLAVSVILLLGVGGYRLFFRGNIVQNGLVIGHT
jgi:hypothetical protein